ncbi:hypothetical protein A3K63_03960 [Candidatus Micrarchaeota archaeon RBG_16_49_10]|nr:MAG: hypothetical protein A3K63_03960 [Candidatus Micrarchaeota archaeon RBG_16_49_10]
MDYFLMRELISELFENPREFLRKLRVKPNVAKIEVKSYIGQETTRYVEKRLKEAEDDGDIKAVLLVIDSPGGSSYHSFRLSHRLRKSKKPVYALIENFGASGAYQVACASEKIIAGEESIVGSIGVVGASLLNYKGLLEKLGIKYILVKAGKHKWGLNQYGEIDEEVLSNRQKMVDSDYERFVGDVAEYRGLERDVVEGYGDIYNAQDVLGTLVDKIGYEDEALDAIKEGLKLEKVKVKSPRSIKNLFGLSLFYAGTKDEINGFFSQSSQAVYRA